MSFRLLRSLVFIMKVVKNKQADRRGQIALFARSVDLSDQTRQRHSLRLRDRFQVSPEGSSRLTLVLCPSMTMERLTSRISLGAPEPPLPITAIMQIRN